MKSKNTYRHERTTVFGSFEISSLKSHKLKNNYTDIEQLFSNELLSVVVVVNFKNVGLLT